MRLTCPAGVWNDCRAQNEKESSLGANLLLQLDPRSRLVCRCEEFFDYGLLIRAGSHCTLLVPLLYRRPLHNLRAHVEVLGVPVSRSSKVAKVGLPAQRVELCHRLLLRPHGIQCSLTNRLLLSLRILCHRTTPLLHRGPLLYERQGS